MHVPNTLSGKEVYTLNKQVSKYGLMALFTSEISIVSLVATYWLWICVTMHVLLRAFSIARLRLAGF